MSNIANSQYQTSVSLLERLQSPNSADSWKRFVSIYTPLLFYWVQRFGFQDADVQDVVQDVLSLVWRQLPSYERLADKRFRGWLWTITANACRERLRRRTPPMAVGISNPDSLHDADNVSEMINGEYDRYVVDRALQLMKSDFDLNTWRACWEFVVTGRPAVEIAKELGISENAVYLAKSRVLRRLRQELEGLLD